MKLAAFRLTDEIESDLKTIANQKFEGNVSMTIRYLIQLGLKNQTFPHKNVKSA